MKFSALAAHCARITPNKIQVTLPLLLMITLYWLSALPGTPLPEDPTLYAVFYWVPPSLQNALHVPVYAILAWCWHWALGAWTRVSSTRAAGAFIITSACGILDEWHQSFVPGRYASLADVMLDAVGAALGIWLAVYASRHATLRLQKQK